LLLRPQQKLFVVDPLDDVLLLVDVPPLLVPLDPPLLVPLLPPLEPPLLELELELELHPAASAAAHTIKARLLMFPSESSGTSSDVRPIAHRPVALTRLR
jgi:hypothetical protein